MHKAREHQQPLYMCFVEFKKAISHDTFWVTMMHISTWDILCTWLTC